MYRHVLVPRRSALPTPGGRHDFDRLFDGLWRGFGPAAAATDSPYRPRIDIVENETHYQVAAELPGMNQDDIEVSLEDGVLTLRGERAAEERSENETVHRVESYRGRFERTLRLPTEVDAEGVSASYNAGVLKVTLPKSAAAVPRNIPISS